MSCFSTDAVACDKSVVLEGRTPLHRRFCRQGRKQGIIFQERAQHSFLLVSLASGGGLTQCVIKMKEFVRVTGEWPSPTNHCCMSPE